MKTDLRRTLIAFIWNINTINKIRMAIIYFVLTNFQALHSHIFPFILVQWITHGRQFFFHLFKWGNWELNKSLNLFQDILLIVEKKNTIRSGMFQEFCPCPRLLLLFELWSFMWEFIVTAQILYFRGLVANTRMYTTYSHSHCPHSSLSKGWHSSSSLFSLWHNLVLLLPGRQSQV